MPTNPESQETQKAVEAKAAPQITDEFLRDLEKNPEKMLDLDKATRNAVLESQGLKSGAEEKPAPGGEPEAKAEGPATENVPRETPVEQKTPTEQEVRAARRRVKELADQANHLEQREKTIRERLEKATKGFEDAKAEAEKVKKPGDFMEDSHQETLQKTVERLSREMAVLREQQATNAKEELQAVETKLGRTKEESTFAHLEELQDHYEGLRTKVPLASLHEKYSTWVGEVVELTGVKEKAPDANPQKLAELALEKWNADPALQAKSKPPEESDKLNLLLAAHHKTARSGGSYRANLLEIMEDEKILETVVQNGRKEAAKEAARSTVDAMQRKNTELQTLSPAEGTSKTDSDKNQQSNQQFMEYVYEKQATGGRLTTEEFERLKKVRLQLAGINP